MSQIFSSIFEMHYFFKDENQHYMDALVRNKCENQLLTIISLSSELFGVDLHPQTLAHVNGGLVDNIKLVCSSPQIQGVILGTLTAVLGTVLSHHLTKDSQLEDLQKEELRMELKVKKATLKKLDQDTKKASPKQTLEILELTTFILNHEYRILRARSEFYRQLQNYPPVTRISTQGFDENHIDITPEIVISRETFSDFILSTEEVPAKIDSNAIIEVISPVLKNNQYNWKGLYNGIPISFSMRDKKFKELICSKQISFTNGMILHCVLEIKNKLNDIGEVYPYNWSVDTVLKYPSKDEFIQTPQGRKYFLDQYAQNNQQSLFSVIPNHQ